MRKLIVILFILSLQGCFAALLIGGGIGAATVKYLQGELIASERASLDKVYQASKRTLKDLELKITVDEKDALSARLIGEGVKDKKYKINLKRESSSQTEVRIRVGAFGDEDAAYLVLEKIEARL